ncbi:sensor histidine kinase [Bacillus sp. FJAT-50079]|uniref:sensor histidine kinase n=1 Tax=Bacillus sp. FJAT-50079 TaxID=2833577 RepID=UPI001BC93B2C|nr:sensor histidine kinase [Bacillus sp. FJAT-50079]MBS4208694.1 sensor histidine kinase [Bacillus sp. FJAT-50079]
MNKIKVKLMIFFLTIFVLMNGVSAFLYINHKHTLSQYDHLLDRFFLINDISQVSQDTFDSMNSFLLHKTQDDLTAFYTYRKQLKEKQRALKRTIMNGQNSVSVKNYEMMIGSFIEETDVTIGLFMSEQIESYPTRQAESFKLLSFLQDRTLQLLNDEFTQFQSYYLEMNGRNQHMEYMGFALFSASFFIVLLFSLLFSENITKPIYQLTKAAHEIALGKLDGEEINYYKKDELGFLTATFNKMRKDLIELFTQIQEKSEQEQLIKEMELKSLQSQINPHFLFNTLNTIGKLAYIEGSDRVQNLIMSLSKLLRYNLSKLEKPVKLKDELHVVQDYFFIQKTRFGPRVNFVVSVDEECLSLNIPILTLQPIVENAFIHGVESLESEGLIEIVGHADSEQVILKIIDNGVGISEETKQSLINSAHTQKHASTGHSTGLGLGNVIRRLQLFYQCEHIYSIHSEIGKGTIVELRLPRGGL